MTGGNMVWTEEEMRRAEALLVAGCGTVPLRSIMNLALELTAARSGTMTTEALADLRGRAEKQTGKHWSNQETFSAGEVLLLLDSHAAQGATVATLQAKVADLEKERNSLAAEMRGHRAEVERLKEQLAWSETQRGQALLGMQAAESRLGAIRERGGSADGLYARFIAALKRGNGREALLDVGRWVLEGDAPNSLGILDGSGGTLDPTEGLPEPELRATMRVVSGGTPEQRSELQALGVEVPQEVACQCDPPFHTCERSTVRCPCSPACTHDDAAKPGHPERVKAQSAQVARTALGMAAEVADDLRHPENDADTFITIDNGVEGTIPITRTQLERYADKRAEAMRAAVENWARGYFGSIPPTLKEVLDGAT